MAGLTSGGLRGLAIAGQICLAIAALFRIFPLMFPIGLLVHELLSPRRWAMLRENARLYGAGAATAAVLIALTSFVETKHLDGILLLFIRSQSWLGRIRVRHRILVPNFGFDGAT